MHKIVVKCSSDSTDSLSTGVHWPAGSRGGPKPMQGGGLGQEFISLLIGPFDHFFQFVLEFFCKRSMTREKNAGLFIFALIREFGGGEG